MIVKSDTPLVAGLHPSPNFEPRCDGRKPSLLVLHYTGMSSAVRAIDWLSRSESKVSSHYVIDDTGRITQMVAENMRAWHAGKSMWHGETDINSSSIGIEIQNPGHEHGYPDFPREQMKAVISLCQDIARRHRMARWNILAHSDVAPARKIDPGEKFNWALLAKAGVGHWVAPAAVDPDDAGLGHGERSAAVAAAQDRLVSYGYGAGVTGEIDAATRFALRAFQLHFRPARCDGRLDRSTIDTLERVIAAREAVAEV